MLVNRVKDRLAVGEVPIGHMVWEFKTRGIASLVASAGCDFVLVDMEHSGLEIDSVADILAWTRATDLTPVVRVPDLEYHFVARCLDAGALGIMFPNVQSEEAALRAVRSVKYPPAGRRGLGLGHAHTRYQPVDTAAYLAEANARTLVITQIESGAGVDNADAIAAVEGVDVLWVGHYDLTASLGIPARFDHPLYERSIARVVEACRRHGKAAGFQPGSPEQASWALSRGFNCLSYGADSVVYATALKNGVARLRELVAEAGRG